MADKVEMAMESLLGLDEKELKDIFAQPCDLKKHESHEYQESAPDRTVQHIYADGYALSCKVGKGKTYRAASRCLNL